MAGDKVLLTMDEGKERPMSQIALYPLRFEPIYQYRLWGGRRLAGRKSSLRSHGFRGGRTVKRLIVFDLNGTLAESKSALDAEMGHDCMTFSVSSKWL